MSVGKVPGMKGLISGSQGKRRFKSDLSVDMISPPLGDFRHTMHVGRGGDVFGDTSFLSNYGGTGDPGSPDSATKTSGFFTRTFRHVRKNSAPRPGLGSRDLSPPPPDISPIIKYAISLPQLNIDSSNGCLQRALFPSSMSSADDAYGTYGPQSGFVTLPCLSRLDRQVQEGDTLKDSFPDLNGDPCTRSDSLASFTVDLGPSLMTEVLSLFDNSSSLQTSTEGRGDIEIGDSEAAEEEEEVKEDEESCSVAETSVQTHVSSVPLRANANTYCSSNKTKPEEEWQSTRTPDGPAHSPQRMEPVIEAERFQKAANVLSRHYGGGYPTVGRRPMRNTTSPFFTPSHGASCAYSDEEEEEEEIKV